MLPVPLSEKDQGQIYPHSHTLDATMCFLFALSVTRLTYLNNSSRYAAVAFAKVLDICFIRFWEKNVTPFDLT